MCSCLWLSLKDHLQPFHGPLSPSNGRGVLSEILRTSLNAFLGMIQCNKHTPLKKPATAGRQSRSSLKSGFPQKRQSINSASFADLWPKRDTQKASRRFDGVFVNRVPTCFAVKKRKRVRHWKFCKDFSEERHLSAKGLLGSLQGMWITPGGSLGSIQKRGERWKLSAKLAASERRHKSISNREQRDVSGSSHILIVTILKFSKCIFFIHSD